MTLLRMAVHAAFVTALLALTLSPHPLRAQDAVLQIVVIQGERAVHDSKGGAAASTVVAVQDDEGRPAPGAEVTFTVPEFGPSGKFADGGRSLVVRADSEGRAEMTGFSPNPFEGEFNVAVSALTATGKGSLVLRQSNGSRTTPAAAGPQARPTSKAKKLLVVLGLGAAAAAASVLATGGGSSASGGASGSPVDPSNPPVTISMGPVAVGAPR